MCKKLLVKVLEYFKFLINPKVLRFVLGVFASILYVITVSIIVKLCNSVKQDILSWKLRNVILVMARDR